MKRAASKAFADAQLWRDIADGKKYLTWRIGHQSHKVLSIIHEDNQYRVYLEGGEVRPIKSSASLDLHWTRHVEYYQKAQAVLSLVQSRVNYPVDLKEVGESEFRFNRFPTQPPFWAFGVEVTSSMLEECDTPVIASLVIQVLDDVQFAVGIT